MEILDGVGLGRERVHPASRRVDAQVVLADWTRALSATADIERHSTRTLPRLIEQWGERNGSAPALLSDGESFTYGELSARLNRYARWAHARGLRRGDTVALMMENRPEYVAAWLGLTKVGVSVALLNTNLRGAALAHCMRAAAPKAAIVSAAFTDAWTAAVPHFETPVESFSYGRDADGFSCLETALAGMSAETSPQSDPVQTTDRALLIYTSGTTGLPKAANVSHGRVLAWALWFAGMLDTDQTDRMYDCLPLYHSVGGVVAVGALLARGGSVVIAPSFSASRFWSDVRRWDCTLAQYIGELCRYLLAAPTDRGEREHRLRAMCGNGLRADIWTAFAERFAVPRVVEFYAASEGTFSLYNMEGEPGAIGRVPGFLRHRFPAAVVRFDDATGLPGRNAEGRCMRVATDEVGESIGRISARHADGNAFQGYTDPEATRAKILRDVFVEGDAWMRTGDLMRIDARGFWFFVDRVGQTFRWKGENVSTLEVANVIADCAGVLDAVVYGVLVPHADGKAGMAALTTRPDFAVGSVTVQVREKLPAYARPLFLRITPELKTTSTFKHQTASLISEGFDPGTVDDSLYWWDANRGEYRPLDRSQYDLIVRGDIRL